MRRQGREEKRREERRERRGKREKRGGDKRWGGREERRRGEGSGDGWSVQLSIIYFMTKLTIISSTSRSVIV